MVALISFFWVSMPHAAAALDSLYLGAEDVWGWLTCRIGAKIRDVGFLVGSTSAPTLVGGTKACPSNLRAISGGVVLWCLWA